MKKLTLKTKIELDLFCGKTALEHNNKKLQARIKLISEVLKREVKA
jgi:hypothetical protein